MRRSLNNEEKSTLLNYLESHFGMDISVFKKFHFERTKRDIWIMPLELLHALPEGHELDKRGLRSFNGEKHPPKPTSTFLQRFGFLINKSVYELDQEQLKVFFQGEKVCGLAPMDNGYAVVRRHGVTIGCGFMRDGLLEPQFPLKVGRSINTKYL